LEGKTKTILLSVIIGILVLTAIIVPVVFFVFLKERPLPVPNAPFVAPLTETKLNIEVDEINKAKGYSFKILNPNNETITILTENPYLYIEMVNPITGKPQSFFSVAGEYEVSCSATSNKPHLDSKYSEKAIFERLIKLEKPTINLHEKNNSQFLNWQNIENATHYDMYIASNVFSGLYSFSSTQNTSSIEKVSLNNLFEDLNLDSGEYQIQIIAKNIDNPYFISSFESDPVLFDYIK
jgi:hypothetical protein